MAIYDVAKNYAMTQLATQITHISLHTAYPPTAGNEISGGSPAYARKSVTWGTPSSGEMAATNQPVFDVPASTTVRAIGYCTAVSGGTYYGDYDVVDEAFAQQGNYTVQEAKINLNK